MRTSGRNKYTLSQKESFQILTPFFQRLEEAAVQREDDGDYLPDSAEEERSDDEHGNLSPAVRALMQKCVWMPQLP